MTIRRMADVGDVVDDLEATTAFFVELGMELEGEAPVEGRWVDRVVGPDDTVHPTSLDRRLAFQLHTKLDKECSSGLEVVHNVADVCHSPNRHVRRDQ